MMIIDRFEGEFAVCELNGKLCNILKNQIDGNPKEGDVLISQGDRYSVSKEDTRRRRSKMIEKQRKLFDR